jgi:hypothetical protein
MNSLWIVVLNWLGFLEDEDNELLQTIVFIDYYDNYLKYIVTNSYNTL